MDSMKSNGVRRHGPCAFLELVGLQPRCVALITSAHANVMRAIIV